MAHAYTPGLLITESISIRKRRLLPIPGEVRVKVGDAVKADTVIARTELPGKIYPVNIAHALSINPADIRRYILKKEGDTVEQGQPLAENRPLIRWFKTRIPAPITGRIESISEISGQVMLREPPRPLELVAYIDGQVVEVLPGQGAVIETVGSFVQGIFGLGGETNGIIRLIVESPEEVLMPEDIGEDLRGTILVGGSKADIACLHRAREVGVKGLIIGGIDDGDLREFLGQELGVAITGTEDLGLTLIITEGFGQIPMAKRTFELLAARQGARASISGATQIRAGVVRPEIIIPSKEVEVKGEAQTAPPENGLGLRIGSLIRIIRAPYFGSIARVVELPAEPRQIETESQLRVLVAQLPGGEQVVVPRANVEIIEEGGLV